MNFSFRLPSLRSNKAPASEGASGSRPRRDSSPEGSRDVLVPPEATPLLDEAQPQSSAQACVSPGLENAINVARHFADGRHFFLGGPAFGRASASGVAMGLVTYLGGFALTGSTLSVIALPVCVGCGVAGGLATEYYKREPFDRELLLDQNVAETAADAREVYASLKEAGVVKSGCVRTPLSAMVSDVLPPHDFDNLSADQRNRLEYLLWTGARADHVPTDLWRNLEVAEAKLAFLHIRHERVAKYHGHRSALNATRRDVTRAAAEIASIQGEIWRAIVRADV